MIPHNNTMKTIKKNIKKVFLEKGKRYNKNQFFVILTKEPLKKISIEEVFKKGTMMYRFEDFYSIVKGVKKNNDKKRSN